MTTTSHEMNNSIDAGIPFLAAESIQYAARAVVSKAILKKPSGNITLFAFDQGEGLAEHSTPHEALVQILEGEAEVTIGGNSNALRTGQSILLPANVPHALKAVEAFKMMLTMIKN